ncbi:DUF5305 family protein [Desulfoscipio gibsoniae]
MRHENIFMKYNKYYLNKKIRLALILLCILSFLAALCFLYYLYRKPAEIVKEVPTYTYEHQGDIFYRADIKPNMVFRETTVMGPDKTIYRDLMDSFTSICAYRFKGSQPAEIKGTYNVTAALEAKDMWKLNYVLIPQTSFSRSGKEVSFRAERAIDLGYFEQVIKQVDEELGVNAREPILTIKTNIDLEADTGGQVLKDKLTPTMIIPLTSGSFQVGDDELTVKKKGLLTKEVMVSNPIRSKLIYAYVAAITSGVLLLMLLLLTQNKPLIQDQRKNIQEFWKEFWKKYGDCIIKTNNEISPTKFVSVNSMEDLVRVADELAKPIIHKEIVSANEPAVCYVLDGPIAYKHVLCINNEGEKEGAKEENNYYNDGQIKNLDISLR